MIASREVSPAFHARYSALSRTYRYALVPGARSPLLARYAWTPWQSPDWPLFAEEARRLEGEHNFNRFRSGTEERPTTRRLLQTTLRVDSGAAYFTLTANGFLRGMVRWIVAALWARATGAMTAAAFTDMLDARSRPETLVPAPPQGLCLVGISYPGDNAPPSAPIPTGAPRDFK